MGWCMDLDCVGTWDCVAGAPGGSAAWQAASGMIGAACRRGGGAVGRHGFIFRHRPGFAAGFIPDFLVPGG